MISIVEIAPKVYRVDNGKGRSWTASLNTPAPRIENESGAAINPSGSLGLVTAHKYLNKQCDTLSL